MTFDHSEKTAAPVGRRKHSRRRRGQGRREPGRLWHIRHSAFGIRNSLPAAWQSGGFTLIELLVVVAILSLLAALLMPALKNARDSAKGAACISNLKQVHLAVMMYCDDNRGWFPGWYDAASDPVNPYWGQKMVEQRYLKCRLLFFNGGVDYLYDGLICPSEPRRKKPGDTDIWKMTTYAISPVSYWVSGGAWVKMGTLQSIPNPDRQILLGDTQIGSQSNFNGNDTSFGMVNGESVQYAMPCLRHRKGWNCVFVDGHIQWFNYVVTNTDQVWYDTGDIQIWRQPL